MTAFISSRFVAALAVVSAAAVAGCSHQDSGPGSSAPLPSPVRPAQSSKLPALPGAKPTTTAVTLPDGRTTTTTVVLIPNPNGDGSMVPCEGTICTNPNHGAGEEPGPPEPGQTTFNGPADGPPEPGQTTFASPAQGPPEPGQTTFNAPADGPPEPGQTTFGDN